MTSDRLSAIAHRRHPIAAPLDDDAVDRLIGLLDLEANARVLDIGCGRAEWLLRILERYDATADGVDISPYALDAAREQATTRLRRPERLRLHEVAFDDFDATGDGYDLVLCIGSTHVLGGLQPTLAAVTALLRPGGLTLIGEGFWQEPPTAAALTGLGAAADEFTDLAGTVALAEQEGFTPLYVHVTSQREWDDYEWSWIGALERHAREHPDEPDTAGMTAVAKEHREGYLGGYRGVLGFATLLLAS